MSSAPFAFTSSFWKRSSAATFLRNREKSVSMSGDCPSTGEYISENDVRSTARPRQFNVYAYRLQC